MIDGSEKRNRQLAFELQNRMFVKSEANSYVLMFNCIFSIKYKRSMLRFQ